MKGLLSKDWRLLCQQKVFFALVAVVTAIMMFAGNVVFALGFVSFVMALFTLSTISYDEFDNGYPFLFTLPITRRGYALEKYVFGLILGGGAWLLATLVALVTVVLKDVMEPLALLQAAGVILLLMVLLQALMIPFHLKFGAEKGRIALIVVLGALAAVIFMVGHDLPAFLEVTLVPFCASLSLWGWLAVLALIVLAVALLWLISLKISCLIMCRKNF